MVFFMAMVNRETHPTAPRGISRMSCKWAGGSDSESGTETQVQDLFQTVLEMDHYYPKRLQKFHQIRIQMTSIKNTK